ncbi:hypothetical protein, partial [Allofournierella massiliensis]|uniref:hypothetical protein n=1 Tax=Allofournierella massiliensis TaxID=1650663 RepID=UPI0035621BB4
PAARYALPGLVFHQTVLPAPNWRTLNDIIQLSDNADKAASSKNLQNNHFMPLIYLFCRFIMKLQGGEFGAAETNTSLRL